MMTTTLPTSDCDNRVAALMSVAKTLFPGGNVGVAAFVFKLGKADHKMRCVTNVPKARDDALTATLLFVLRHLHIGPEDLPDKTRKGRDLRPIKKALRKTELLAFKRNGLWGAR